MKSKRRLLVYTHSINEKGERTESVQSEGTEAPEVHCVHVWEGGIEIHYFLLLRQTVKRSPADSWAQSSLRNAELKNILQRAKEKIDSILHFQKRRHV